jgi:hypothetical protein
MEQLLRASVDPAEGRASALERGKLTMDRTTQTPLSAAELNEANLAGATIWGANDERIGSISHLHNLDSSPQAVVDVGGFLGIGSKPVLIGLTDLNMVRDANGTVFGFTTWTKDQLKARPEHRD